MDTHMRSPHMRAPPPSDTSFPILAISILGILATAILLLGYYVFVISPEVLLRLSNDRSLRQRRRLRQEPLMVYSTTSGEDGGLEESAIRTIPTFRFGRKAQDKTQRSFHECAVCLNEFQEEERLRLLPSCLHVFHIDCIDTWLQANANCPVCRSDITTTSLSHADHLISQNPYQNLHHSGNLVLRVVELRDDDCREVDRRPSPSKTEQKSWSKKACSMGDECIDVREKDEHFSVHFIRRSFSMDSCCDRQLYLSVQKILQQNQHFQEFLQHNQLMPETSSSSALKSCFSLGHCRTGSRKATLPI